MPRRDRSGLSPQLVFRQRSVRCGYAPRVCYLSSTEDVLFVGCKDGSFSAVRMVQTGIGEFEARVLRTLEASNAGIRAICDWDRDHALLGHSDGCLELVRWRTEDAGLPNSSEPCEEITKAFLKRRVQPGDPVQTLGWLDPSRMYVSFRHGGCWIVQREDADRWSESMERLTLPEKAGAVRLVLPLARSPAAKQTERWLLVTEGGELCHWDGEIQSPAERFHLDWPSGERPAAVNDYGLKRNDEQRQNHRPAHCAFLATDTGVYLVLLNRNGELEPCRLSLSGLGAMCTAVTYTEDDEYRYLWAADARGDCHLFWDDQQKAGEEMLWLNFRRSGLVHADSQVLAGFSWCSKSLRTLVFGQARRDDQIVLGQYWRLPEQPEQGPPDRPTELRQILSDGTPPKIAEFLAQLDRERHGEGHQVTPALYEDWLPQAILVELVERVATDGEYRRIVLESLLGGARLADDILHDIVDTWRKEKRGKTPPKQAQVQRRRVAERLLHLWTLTLLGVIHRHPGDREGAYLGLLRWLRNRQQALGDEPAAAILIETIEDSIRFARKWGVYGEANGWRQNLTWPLKRLEQHEGRQEELTSHKHGASPRKPGTLDRLTYLALLYERGWSLIDFEDRSRKRGRTAWDIASLEIANRRVVAVSWNWGGIELFEIAGRGNASKLIPRYALRPRKHEDDSYDLVGEDLDPATALNPRYRYGYSRAIHLGRIDGIHYLLAAPATKRKGGKAESVFLWQLGWADDSSLIVRDVGIGGFEIPAGHGESIYSLVDLSNGWLLAGLRGSRGVPKVALLHITRSGESLTMRILLTKDLDEPSSDEEMNGEQETGAGRNRVWSLAKARLPKSRCRVIVGCEGGEIYRLTLRRSKGEWDLDPGSPPTKLAISMSSPVYCLAYREARGKPSRLYAGGEDGSIVAWQQIDSSPGYASLWATSEQGAIASIHLLEDYPIDERLGAVLVVTRRGKCVLFDDGPDVPAPKPDHDQPRRFPVPGSRHGRPTLGISCFASMIAETTSSSAPKKAPYAPSLVLLAASGEGTLRLVNLREPHYTSQRSDRYQEILRTWWKIIEGGHQLRLGGAVYRAAPVLELILVRWLLDPSHDSSVYPPWTAGADEVPPFDFKHPGFQDWWLPRHLRPMLELRKEWDKLLETREDIKERAATAGYALELALRRAWQLDDIKLFQEICEVVLKRGNVLLYRTVRSKETHLAQGEERWRLEKEAVHTLYENVFAAIERTLQRWLGSEESGEARARMVVAKNLVNGDTFWMVLTEAAQEFHARETPAPFRAILQRRIMGVSELVFKRHPLVSLETLRSANLSLLRLCRRLSDHRKTGADSRWKPDPENKPSEGEVFWPVFEPYFTHLIAAAARSFRSRLELNDALTHEYSRTFALAIFLCPSAAIRIANRMTETRLISDLESEDDLSNMVGQQLDLLESLGLTLPEETRMLLKLITEPRGDAPSTLGALLDSLELGDPAEPSLARSFRFDAACQKVGWHNSEDLQLLCHLHDLVGWFSGLEKKLSTDARWIDLSRQCLERLQSSCRELETIDVLGLYTHSRNFWQDALAKLSEKIDIEIEASDRVRPEIVLVSGAVVDWAATAIGDLDERYRTLKIFQPEYRIFRETLARLQRAAEEFPRSAAVQKNIVEGILGHHLLEDLDEHVFELIEIAQALDPLMVWTERDQGPGLVPNLEGRLPATAETFAHYLLGRSRNAESIPKNLRTLQGLLLEEEKEEEGPVDVAEKLLTGLLPSPTSRARGDEAGWMLVAGKGMVSYREVRFLRLALDELDQNDRVYGCRPKFWPRISIERRPESSLAVALKIRFRFRKDIREKAVKRLEALRKNGLQLPCQPWPGRILPSRGTGLYLANLAAAVVQWQLKIDEINRAEDEVVFMLERLQRPGEIGDARE